MTGTAWAGYAAQLRHIEDVLRQQEMRHAGARARQAAERAACEDLLRRLAEQRDDLERIARELRLPAPAPVPGPVAAVDAADALARARDAAARAEQALQCADDAADAGRLAGWPVWARNGLAYGGASLLLLAVFTAITLAGASAGRPQWSGVQLLAVPCCGAPLFSAGLGYLACGRLFRSRRGGPVDRTPVAGIVISFLVPWLLCGSFAALFG